MARGCNYKPPPFLSTLSLRRATVRPRCRGCPAAYFYPRSPCGERPLVHQLRGLADVSISIHALLAESDCGCFVRFRYWEYFYPRSPCGERRHCCSRHNCLSHYFYPRSPCGERPIAGRITSNGTKISIHALLAESDICTLMVQL